MIYSELLDVFSELRGKVLAANIVMYFFIWLIIVSLSHSN